MPGAEPSKVEVVQPSGLTHDVVAFEAGDSSHNSTGNKNKCIRAFTIMLHGL